ncbi:OmpA family protein [Parasphingopyxis lamellibrachiae]|uniref:Outer membrane protein OmpA-like peptidoglycan-associated protein n=1 Tax=Parasphingopyxis lamellibrachiae TaxID=680125 RepID=A0A3D9FHX6_9SPHN|nr:OmpA family protein [Parasphingopyxis lamellibrachiae]RED17393.1 outer membrane protein OmpA-like peptidoglycan-associated protein [Parasphingopyxis lamellibrachiae]
MTKLKQVTARKLLAGSAIVGMIGATAACTTNPETGNQRISRAAIGGVAGAVGGYLIGDLVGGRRDRTERIVGAGLGAVAGIAIGTYMDRQQRELEQATAGTDTNVIRDGDNLYLQMPGSVAEFDVDSSTVRPQFRATLDEIAQTLNSYPETYIDIYGHTDSDGSDGYNLDLSNRRAQSVAGYLASRGVNRARMATEGFGESQPIASNATAAGKQQNRRVEIRIVPITQQDVNAAGN